MGLYEYMATWINYETNVKVGLLCINAVSSRRSNCIPDPFLRQIYGEHTPLYILANCNLAIFGEFYQHLCQVCQSSNGSNGERSFSRKILAGICGEQ